MRLLRVIFFGTPIFAIPVLEKLVKTPTIKVLAVITQPDRPAGRQQILTSSPVKNFARNHKIRVIDSDSLPIIIGRVKTLKPDIGVLAAYGKIIPQDLINLFPKGILVIHPSLLPAYRGASPVQATILNGDPKTGVSIILMDAKMDHGPIISQFEEEILTADTAETLTNRLFALAAEELVTILPAWVIDKIKPRPQNHKKATYTKILKRADGYLDPGKLPSPDVLERMIRAYYPWPGVYTKLKMKNACLPPACRADRTGQGKIKIIKFLPEGKIQLEGKNPLMVKDFLRAYPEEKTWLSKIFPYLVAFLGLTRFFTRGLTSS